MDSLEKMAVAVVRVCLIGFGTVNQNLVRIGLLQKADILLDRYRLKLCIVGVADSGGAVSCPTGLDAQTLLDHKALKRSVHLFEGAGCSKVADAEALVREAEFDILVESSVCSLHPALPCVRTALSKGCDVVLANKAPLVDDFSGLHALAASKGANLAFSATVCGGLPVLNVGQRDLVAASFTKAEGVFNSTSNFILETMGSGGNFADALAEAQRLGIAEADPSLDIDGGDTANKLIIIANAVLGMKAKLSDCETQGIREITPDAVAEAAAAGEVYKLIATADWAAEGTFKLSVAPKRVPSSSFLGTISGWEMGVMFQSDLFERIWLKIDEPNVVPTASAVLRDVVHLWTRRQR